MLLDYTSIKPTESKDELLPTILEMNRFLVKLKSEVSDYLENNLMESPNMVEYFDKLDSLDHHTMVAIRNLCNNYDEDKEFLKVSDFVRIFRNNNVSMLHSSYALENDCPKELLDLILSNK